MTLGKQLIIAISLLFLAVLIGVESIHLRSARAHLQDQLESHAQDAATSLGLSLGVLLGRGDYAIAETVINAAFDRGHYDHIELVTLDKGDAVVSKRMPPQFETNYPGWFGNLFRLTGPTAESMVSTGWQQVGKVRVTSHPRFAYEQLWTTARDTLLWTTLIYLVALAVLRLFLSSLLKPLYAVEQAAEAISRREFLTVEERPRTRELARVVTAMNSLSGKVRAALEAETARAAQLQDEAYLDPVSGLLNRRGLTAQFNSHHRDEAGSYCGAFGLLQVTDLAHINERQGPERGDELVRLVAKRLGECAKPEGLAGRWGGALFALVLPEISLEAAVARLEQLQKQAESAVAQLGLAGSTVAIAIGAVHVEGGKPVLKKLVEAANEALQQAVNKRMGLPEVRPLDAAQSYWTAELIDVVRLAISAGKIALVGQPAVDFEGRVLHTEIMGRLLDSRGKQLLAAEFMPLVARHRLGVEFDQATVRKVLYEARGLTDPCTLAVNLAPQSIADPAFLEWLTGVLGRGRPSQLQLVFEVSEHGVLQNEAAARKFGQHAEGLGVALAIDHFGVHRDSLALVRRLSPAYVKLSSVHTPRMVADMGTRFFTESVVRAGKQLDVPVIAQSVEDEPTVSNLKALGLHGYQGYVSGKPAAWPPQNGAPVSS